MMNKNNKISASFTILTLSFGLLFIYTTTIQGTQILTPVDAATTQHKDNPTQGTKSAANQTGEKMQSGAANATQGTKSAANQTGEKMQSGAANATQAGQSLTNKTGEAVKSIVNKTGEALQKINPFK
jgi:hypothetical protein